MKIIYLVDFMVYIIYFKWLKVYMFMNNNEKNVCYWYLLCILNVIWFFRVLVLESIYFNVYFIVECVLMFI